MFGNLTPGKRGHVYHLILQLIHHSIIQIETSMSGSSAIYLSIYVFVAPFEEKKRKEKVGRQPSFQECRTLCA